MTQKRASGRASSSSDSAAGPAERTRARSRAAAAVERGRVRIAESGADWVVGSDESGFGTWAGDLIICGIAVRRDWSDPSVTDSKALSDAARRCIVRRYREAHEVYRIVHRTPPSQIDEVGVWVAAICAHNSVHEALEQRLCAVDPYGSRIHIVDGFENAGRDLHPRILPLSKADTFVPAVSLASCFAKVVQCELMNRAAQIYPGYGFERNCGYGTPEHQRALAELGVLEIHRRSYRPIRDLISNGSFTHRRR